MGLMRTTAELTAACEKARAAGVLALDTEFVWRCTYHPQLSLVQMGCGVEDSWALDVLTGVDTTALKSVIEDAGVVKILHDAHQDLTHLHHYTGAVPRNVFDTQVAAAFTGFGSGAGLQKLLFEAINVGLAKTETLTNWMQRPLTAQQMEYALDDVRYLPELRAALLAKADEYGTRSWLEEEMAKMNEPALYNDMEPSEAWKKIKLHRTELDGRGRAILRAVAALREEMAREWKKPRAWCGEDGSLVDMAAKGEVGKLRHRLNHGQGATLEGKYAEAIRAAKDLPEEEWPEDPHPHYIAEVKSAAGEALEWLETKAEELHVSAAAIATRAMVTAFVDDVTDETNPLASGWRYEVVGREMAEKFGVD